MMRWKIFTGWASLFAVAALAALPAIADAAPFVSEGGVIVKVNEKVVGTNFGNTAFTAFDGTTDVGTVTCTSSVLTGPLPFNSAVVGIDWELTSATFTGAEAENKCGSTLFGATKVTVNALPYCFTSTVFGAFEMVGGACGKGGTLRITLAGAFVTCTYETAKNIVGTYAVEDGTTEATKMKLEKQTLPGSAGNGPGCPEKVQLGATYTLETDGTTTALAIHK